MKSSNPQVMVEAYRLLVETMQDELESDLSFTYRCYRSGGWRRRPYKIGHWHRHFAGRWYWRYYTGILTEDPEFEIPVCQDIVARYHSKSNGSPILPVEKIPYSPFEYARRKTHPVYNIGGTHAPVVVADYRNEETITRESLGRIGYDYDDETDKWKIGDAAADYIYTGNKLLDFNLPGTLKVICNYEVWKTIDQDNTNTGEEKYFPLINPATIL